MNFYPKVITEGLLLCDAVQKSSIEVTLNLSQKFLLAVLKPTSTTKDCLQTRVSYLKKGNIYKDLIFADATPDALRNKIYVLSGALRETLFMSNTLPITGAMTLFGTKPFQKCVLCSHASL